jgi:hypothetical protein
MKESIAVSNDMSPFGQYISGTSFLMEILMPKNKKNYDGATPETQEPLVTATILALVYICCMSALVQ